MKLVAASVAFLSIACAADRPAFEVASIKATDPNPENAAFVGMTADGARVQYTNITLRDCIRAAFRVQDFQIVGPDWMTKARYEINAKLPAGGSMDQIPEMLQSLLEQRFKMEARRISKETNVYALVVGSGGAKLKPAEAKAVAGAPTALGPDGKPVDIVPAPSLFDALQKYGLRLEKRREPVEMIEVVQLERNPTEN
jgi:uncharacterized protein (TIGR03435 family)